MTQKQIAAHLGISQSQVAHALKGYERISEKTRQRVEEAAKELGHGAHSNSAARSLRARRGGNRARTHIIAVLMGEFFDGMPVHELPFYKPILKGLKAEAEQREMDVSFFSPNPESSTAVRKPCTRLSCAAWMRKKKRVRSSPNWF